MRLTKKTPGIIFASIVIILFSISCNIDLTIKS